ncbi:DUF192 domain-containing protein [Roseovarius sp. 2305UL8-3]|uniref:DUF192 domain-containing protein n=1 Tax=Roseovarius conchicola TaxID=3121636 RepID=UPI003527C9AC
MGNGGKILRLTLSGLIATLGLALTSGSALASECREDQVHLRGDWGQARFTVELADDDEERAQGLMGRESMARSAGMLFVYPRPRLAGFWMKNTLIPLDMIFMDKTGTVTHVHHEAVPLDERPIFGGDNILAVLEINGGLARQMGIAAGTQLRHPAFDAAVAVWPCDSTENASGDDS